MKAQDSRTSPIVAALKRFIGRSPEPAERPIECIFSLNPQKRKLYLLDLKAILRLPDARLALPNVGNLETTIRRNRERIRIPYDAMLPLVRELLSVRHRVPAKSPLVEIMTAIPGLVNTVLTGPLPTSALLEGRDISIHLPGIPPAEQEAEVARIRALIAGKKPPPAAKPAGVDGAAAIVAAAQDTEGAATAITPRVVANLGGNSRTMTPADQRRFLERSAHDIESVAMSTGELSDEDMSGYVDLCILNGDHERVLGMLVNRVAEQPRAWAWLRLLELAEAARDPRFAQLKGAFLAWARQHHPEMVASDNPAAPGENFHGVGKGALQALAQREIGASTP